MPSCFSFIGFTDSLHSSSVTALNLFSQKFRKNPKTDDWSAESVQYNRQPPQAILVAQNHDGITRNLESTKKHCGDKKTVSRKKPIELFVS